MSGMRIGVDIGGTKVDAVVLDEHDNVIARHRTPVRRGPDGVVASATEAVAKACATPGIAPGDASCIGVGVPGAVVDGVVRHALNLDVDEFDLATALHGVWGVPVTVENDVNVAAVGAARLIAGAGRSVAYLNVGTGLAAGIILDGRLWRGAHGAAGEIGHISIDPDGPVGSDGLPGGLETYASGSGMTLQWGVEGATALEVLGAARGGDERAITIRDNLMLGVATAVRVLVLTLDVDRVVLGGGLTGLGDELTDGARSVIGRWEQASPFLASLGMAQRMSVAPAGEPIAAVGAALLEATHG